MNGDWFVARPSWGFQEETMVGRIERQTENRVYYGEAATPLDIERADSLKAEFVAPFLIP